MNDSRLKKMTERISDDVLNGLCALAILDALPQQLKANNLQSLGPFWKTAYDNSVELLLIAISRNTDTDSDSVNVASTLNYLEQNRLECVWLHSAEGREKHDDPDASILIVLDRWRKWLTNDELVRVRALRDKTIAHRDKNVSLNGARLAKRSAT